MTKSLLLFLTFLLVGCTQSESKEIEIVQNNDRSVEYNNYMEIAEYIRDEYELDKLSLVEDGVTNNSLTLIESDLTFDGDNFLSENKSMDTTLRQLVYKDHKDNYTIISIYFSRENLERNVLGTTQKLTTIDEEINSTLITFDNSIIDIKNIFKNTDDKTEYMNNVLRELIQILKEFD